MDKTPRALREGLFREQGILLVTRAPAPAPRPAPGQPGVASDFVPDLPEVFIAIRASGEILAFNGHVDLGTGIRTALAQIVAEELEVEPAQVAMVLGHTEATPNQGPTIASASIQISAVPLRRAAAQARAWLSAQAGPGQPRDLHRLLAGRHVELTLADDVATRPVEQYRVVGRSVPRVDIPAKATGELTFVHDVRVPGMLHGRVIRPPYAGRDSGASVGASLIAVDESSLDGVRGVVRVVVEGDFIGVVAEREEQAIEAARRLQVRWKPVPPLPDLNAPEAALRAAPARRRPLKEAGDPATALDHSHHRLTRSYVWPYQMHGSIGPSCAVADWRDDRLTLWSGTQNPHMLRVDMARLTGLGEGAIEIIRMEAAGCYGRNCADDVCADAALLSRAVGRPVRVQLSREQEHLWEPKGAAQLMDVEAGVTADGALTGYRFVTRYPSNDAPILAMVLTGRLPSAPRMLEMGDRTAVPPYDYPAMQIDCDDTPAIVRASWLRGVSALPNTFAHESMIDELAHRCGADPLDFRLRHLTDDRARELLIALAGAAQWRQRRRGSRGRPDTDGLLRGRGLAYARYIHSRFPGFGAAWAAWIVDLEVDPRTGTTRVTRVYVAQDTGMVVNPDGVRHQIHGNVVQSLSRALREQVRFDDNGVVSREWGSYPIAAFPDLPPIEVLLMPRQSEPPLGAGESASLPGAPAVANALFDATGIRFTEAPFTPEMVLRARAAADAVCR